MAIPELDLKKVNLQSAVGYLISLHDNEVDWNLLGIKVIGAIDSLPIPEGDYEYGDAYMVGTETPYDMYIYTRPDGEVHTEGYWFPIGKFPAPGPQGPKGDGLEQIYKWTNGTVSNVVYDTTDGAKTTQTTTIDYTDSTDGSTKQQQFNSTTTLPIVPGKYVSMDATADNKKLEVKVDDTALALDYIKISKTEPADSSPVIEGGKTVWYPTTQYPQGKSFAWRNPDGNCAFNQIAINNLCDINYNNPMPHLEIARTVKFPDNVIAETSSDSGVLNATDYEIAKGYQNTKIVYKNQLYYCMDPRTAPDGTLNFIHIDSIQDGEGGYKATGKCFSITVSTRAWQVVDLDFGGSTRTTHNLTIFNSTTATSIYFTLVNNHTESYESAAALLWEALTDKNITCTVDSNGKFDAGALTTDGDNFKALYGDGQELLMTQSQISITDIIS